MNKTVTTACGKNVSISTFVEKTEYFKYEVVQYTPEGTVKFKILNSPRCDASNQGQGELYLSIRSPELTVYVASHNSPSLSHDVVFVKGIDASKDDKVLECSIDVFNLMQLGMLIWNVSVCRHNAKKIYQKCVQCGSVSHETINLNAIESKFYLTQYSCCPMPERLNFSIVNFDTPNNENIHIRFKAINALGWINRGNDLRPDYLSNVIHSLVTRLHAENERPRAYVPLLCSCCGKKRQEEFIPLYRKNTGEVSAYHIYSEMSSEISNFCNECLATITTCPCGNLTRTPRYWRGEAFCEECQPIGHCYICHLDEDEESDAPDVPIRNLVYVDPRSGNSSRRYLCETHFIDIELNGWSNIELASELSWSFKIDPQRLIAHVPEKYGKDPRVIEVAHKVPLASLEWEFPFSSKACQTTTRDRAIWKFQQVMKSCGFDGLFIPKHDGSLPNFATEWVTERPASLEMWHELYFNGVLDKLAHYIDADVIKQQGHHIGGHIHISKMSFTPTQVTKYLQFLYKNLDFLEFVCNRPQQGRNGDNHYYSHEAGIHPLAFAHKHDAISPEKYTIARVTSLPSHHGRSVVDMGTIEVRAFRSPKSAVELLQNVEFMFALREYVKHHSGAHFDKPERFINFVQSHAKYYPLFHEKVYNRTKETFQTNRLSCPTWRSKIRILNHQGAIIKADTSGSSSSLRGQSGIFRCERCADTFSNSDAFDIYDSHYCEDCYGRLAAVCERCNETTYYNEMSEVVRNTWGSEMWCSDCTDDYACYCNHHERYEYGDMMCDDEDEDY